MTLNIPPRTEPILYVNTRSFDDDTKDIAVRFSHLFLEMNVNSSFYKMKREQDWYFSIKQSLISLFKDSSVNAILCTIVALIAHAVFSLLGDDSFLHKAIDDRDLYILFIFLIVCALWLFSIPLTAPSGSGFRFNSIINDRIFLQILTVENNALVWTHRDTLRAVRLSLTGPSVSTLATGLIGLVVIGINQDLIWSIPIIGLWSVVMATSIFTLMSSIIYSAKVLIIGTRMSRLVYKHDIRIAERSLDNDITHILYCAEQGTKVIAILKLPLLRYSKIALRECFIEEVQDIDV